MRGNAATELILLEKVEHLGSMGDLIRVKPGYARNFLIPQRKAIRATRPNLEQFERERMSLEKQNTELRVEATRRAERFEGFSVPIIRQASESGSLFGSVSARDIAEACGLAGLQITRRQVRLDRRLQSIGTFSVPLFLHPEVMIPVIVNVARSHEEAKRHLDGDPIPAHDEEENDGHAPPPRPALDARLQTLSIAHLLRRLETGPEESRVEAFAGLARFLVEEQDVPQSGVKPMRNSLRSIPAKLLDALVREADSEKAGKAAAIALACFLAPNRYRGTDLDHVDEAVTAKVIQQAFHDRGLGYFSIVSVVERKADGASIRASLRNSFGFRLAGQLLELEPPDWLDRDKGLELQGYGLNVLDLMPVPADMLPEGTLAACTARLSPEADAPEKVSLYLCNGDTVFDRFLYSVGELFPPSETNDTNASSAVMKSHGISSPSAPRSPR